MRIALLCVLGLGASAAIAHAQSPSPAKPTQQQLDEAREHFKAAEAAKARGEFKTAAVEYLAAYERFQDPEFFFNTAEVYRLAKDEPTALMYYQKYLELDSNGRGAAAARTAAEELRKSIAATEDANRGPAVIANERADGETRRPGQNQVATNKIDEPESELVVQRSSTGRGMRIAGLTAGGAGVVALGIGIAFGARARSISNEASRWDTFDHARHDEGKAAERNMFIFTGLGAATLVAGGVLYYLGYRAGQVTPGDAASVTLVPAIEPTHVGVAAAGHF